MSGQVGAYGGADYGLRDQLVADSLSTQLRVASLTQQAASGLRSGTYAGLGDGARVSLDLSPEIAYQKAVASGIDQATTGLGVAQGALSQITQVAQTLFAQLNTASGIDTSEVDSVAAQARTSLVQVAGLLDATDGGAYVFAGQDGGNPPVPNPDAILGGAFFAKIGAAVSALSVSGAAATAASTLATASSDAAGTTPFSAYLSAAASAGADVRPTVQTGIGGAAVAAGIAANANGYVASTGASTTGSYVRDILRALATVGSLTSAQAGTPDFEALVQDTRTSLGGAITAIGQDAGALGDVQNELTGISADSAATQTALAAQVSDAQDADEASVATQLSLAQTQLQASFTLIAGLNKLSLVNYL